MPFDTGDILVNLMCGKRPDGHWFGVYQLQVRASALRKYGLHPDQPWSDVLASQPAWWRADALRLMLDSNRHRRRQRP
ncbi:MAG: hypothetical protein HOW97_25575 [Catenulispora sp.]|nr:hypothetical protein [Catenulispora sp.]